MAAILYLKTGLIATLWGVGQREMAKVQIRSARQIFYYGGGGRTPFPPARRSPHVAAPHSCS